MEHTPPKTSTAPVTVVTGIEQLSIGDQLFRRKGIVMHVGIYIGNQLILHNTPIKGEHAVDFNSFANGKTVYARSTPIASTQVITSAQKILEKPESYQLFKRNCEHTANQVINHLPYSAQLAEIETWALLGGAYGKSFGKTAMYLGGAVGAVGGLLSLTRMLWLK